jgi:NTP pyrophosphatase (non-canonical NTP hydrolase)
MGKLKELQDEQVPWVKHNFGDRESWQPVLGIIEEMGELDKALYEGDREEILDSIADVMIYMADYCSAMGFDVEEQWRLRRQNHNYSLMEWAGQLAHYHLKMQQGIRGDTRQHRIDIQIVLQILVGVVDAYAVAQGTTAETLAFDTWQKVKQRDWKKYPRTGVEVK